MTTLTPTQHRALPLQCHCHHLLTPFLQSPRRLSPFHVTQMKTFELIVSGYPAVFIRQLISLELSGPKSYMRAIWRGVLPSCKMLLVMLTFLCAFLGFSMACRSNRQHTSLIGSSGLSFRLISRKRRAYSLVLPMDSGLPGEGINLGGIKVPGIIVPSHPFFSFLLSLYNYFTLVVLVIGVDLSINLIAYLYFSYSYVMTCNRSVFNYTKLRCCIISKSWHVTW